MKRLFYWDREDLVYRMELTYDEIVDILDMKYIAGSTIGYTLPPSIYEISDLNLTLKSLLPNELEVNNTIDDNRLASNLTTNKTTTFTEKSFFYTILGITQSHSGPLSDIKRFVQTISGTYKNEKPINITGSDEIHLKCDRINGGNVNSIREPFLYSLGLDKPLGYKIYKDSRIKKITKCVLSHIT